MAGRPASITCSLPVFRSDICCQSSSVALLNLTVASSDVELNSKWCIARICGTLRKSVTRNVSHSRQVTPEPGMSCATFGAALWSTTSASCSIVKQSERRYLRFNKPKHPSTRQRVWPAIMKLSVIFVWRPFKQRQAK